jgi:hypothetical protein
MITVANKTCVKQSAVTSSRFNTIKIRGNYALKYIKKLEHLTSVFEASEGNNHYKSLSELIFYIW